MNERIQQLWWQAGGHLSQGNQHGWPHYTIDDPEKFAELIVRECARVARATPFPDTDVEVRKTFGHTWDMASVEAGREIVKHFGVEE
jgi:hypothetical protein